MPAIGTSQIRQIAGRMAQFGLDRARMLGQRAPEPGRYNATAGAREELHIKGSLELANGPRESRLRDVQRFRRDRHAAMIDDRQQVKHLADIQISDLR
jgi:hypothetical protein